MTMFKARCHLSGSAIDLLKDHAPDLLTCFGNVILHGNSRDPTLLTERGRAGGEMNQRGPGLGNTMRDRGQRQLNSGARALPPWTSGPF
jgi:hypothetical protein